MLKRISLFLIGLLVAGGPGWVLAGDDGCNLSDMEQLGKFILFDPDLSANANQACAACHSPQWGGTGPSSAINATGGVYEGSVPGLFGNRKPPSFSYGGDSPVLFLDGDTWTGGMFWDGRATGWTLGDPLAEQAQGPFLAPPEQALPNPAAVVERVCAADYGDLFTQVWGETVCDDVVAAYEAIARSIAAYERSIELNPFSSKFDAYLSGMAELTADEQWGLELFDDPAKGNCAACHISDGDRPLFTDFTYDNLGVPKNRMNPFYSMATLNPMGKDWLDEGLGGFLKGMGEPESIYGPEMGKVKVPTLRNVDLRPEYLIQGRRVKGFGHNGYFKSLKQIVHFYNTRDALSACDHDTPGEGVTCWPPPEIPDNVNTDELGDLGLTELEEDAIVAFLTALSDGYMEVCND
ncbi:MAG: cytochrome C, partial [bacterium]|nr:cytochrome C [bacterium]